MAGLKGKKIIVTGGAGFIGGHLVNALLSEAAEVLVVDIALDPNSTYISSGDYRRTQFELTDIRDRKDIERVVLDFQPDFIFHLAAEAIVEESFDNPVKAFETNVMGTVNVLEAARKLKNIKGIIVASSDKAYGKSDKEYKEDFPLKGDHPYDVSKSSQDLISTTYYKTYNLPIVITRFGNVYGEGDVHFSRIIPGICKAVIRNQTLEIRSDGKYVRDYLYVKDVVSGYLFLITRLESILGEAFNFSSPNCLNVLDVVGVAEKALSRKIRYVVKNNAKNEIPYQHLDDSKVKKLGWKSSHTLSSSLPDILKWYSEIL